jgi:SAM-dependent methyltransferase
MPQSTVPEGRLADRGNGGADGSPLLPGDRLAQPADEKPRKDAIRASYDRLAGRRDLFRRRNRYYYRLLIEYLRFLIPPGRSVLEVGCGDGYVLRRLEPDHGLGCDLSAEMIEKARRDAGADARVEFVQADIEETRFRRTYDFVVMTDLLGDLLDIQHALDNVRSACAEESRVVITYHGIAWEPFLKLAQRLGWKSPQLHHNWLAPGDVAGFAELCDFEIVRFDRRVLLPKGIPLVSTLLNRFVAPLPLINYLCLLNLVVLRKRPRQPRKELSTTVVIPCRNEQGNIRPAVERLPAFGTSQEIIFVDGHSTDGTPDEIRRVISDFPEKEIRFFVQQGRGKGDAVRLGFSEATRDVLMILDADLTVPPEDLPKFYGALASGRGEFVNGSRLVYPMEDEAMRALNILGNKFFSVALSWLLNTRLKDTLCGTKVLLRSDYERIAAGRHYFGDFDPFGDFDLLFGASKLNLKIVEVPVRYRQRTYGSTNISRFRHGLLLLRMTLFALRKLKSPGAS